MAMYEYFEIYDLNGGKGFVLNTRFRITPERFHLIADVDGVSNVVQATDYELKIYKGNMFSLEEVEPKIIKLLKGFRKE